MSVIVCEINLGVMNQSVYLQTGDRFKHIASIPVSDIGHTLAGLCYSCGAYNLKLKGPKDYLTGVIKDVRESENRLYAMNKIEIEVM